MKICSFCKENKPESEFARRGEGLQAACRQCKAEYNRKHYQNNKGAYLARAEKGRGAIRSYLDNEKRVPCMDCGESYPPYVMDLDHVRGKKLFNLSNFKFQGMIQVKEERAKCDVVCSNCHRKRTHARS